MPACSTTGYNAPELAEADFNTRTYGSLEFRQDYVADHYDEIYIRAIVDEDTGEAIWMKLIGLPSRAIIGLRDSPAGLRHAGTVRLGIHNEPLYKPGGEERNDAHCSKMEENNVQPVTYSVTGFPSELNNARDGQLRIKPFLRSIIRS